MTSSFQAKALFDFNAQANNEMNLTANTVYTIHEINDAGWWHATNVDGKQHGWVPSNYMKRVDPEVRATPPREAEMQQQGNTPQSTPATSNATNHNGAGPAPDSIFCAICQDKINDTYFVLSSTERVHERCFRCSGCSRTLEGHYMRRETRYYCEDCYHQNFSKKCAQCQQPCKQRTLSALGKNWHPQCFVCNTCRQPFPDGRFKNDRGTPYCSPCWQRSGGM